MQPNALSLILIGNMVTSHVAKRYITLTLSLAVMIKKLVEKLYQYDVVSSYDELMLFRASAAEFANMKMTVRILRHYSLGLVQCRR